MESIHIETDLELSEITQYFRTSEVCPTLLHSSSCILIGCFACPKIVGLVDMECQNGMNFACSFAIDFFGTTILDHKKYICNKSTYFFFYTHDNLKLSTKCFIS